MVANIFGKIVALKGKLDYQNLVSRLSRQYTKLGRDISRAEKQMSQMKRAEINQVKQSYSIFTQSNIAKNLAANTTFAGLFTNGAMDYTKCQENKALYDQYNQALQSQQMMAQNDMQAALDEIEERYEWYQETQIQAMKDEQEDIQVQQEAAKFQIQAYESMEQTEGEFAKKNIQSMFSNNG